MMMDRTQPNIASIIHELRVSGDPTEENWADVVESFKDRVEELTDLASQAQKVLAMMVDPIAIKTTSVMQAFANAQEIECKLRSALEAKHD
jgi:hypothetical protein